MPIDPYKKLSNSSSGSEPLKAEEVKHLKINPVKKAWNGLLDKFSKKKRLVKLQTHDGEITTTVKNLAKKAGIAPSDKQGNLALSKALKAYKSIDAIVEAGPWQPWMEHIDAVKETIYIAAELGTQSPPTLEDGGQREMTIGVGKTDLTLHAIDDGEELKIVGLFGKELDKGAFGAAIRLVNLISGKLSVPEESIGVVKECHETTDTEKQSHYQLVFENEIKMNKLLKEKLVGMPENKKRFFAPGYDAQDSLTRKNRLVLPLIAGQNLFDYMAENEVDFSMKKKIANDILEAVQTLHEMGIYHLDLKIDNFMIEFSGDEPKVTLIDLGSAQSMETLDPTKYARSSWLGGFEDQDDRASPILAFEEKLKEPVLSSELPQMMDRIDQKSLALDLLEMFSGVRVARSINREEITDQMDALIAIDPNDENFDRLVNVAFKKRYDPDFWKIRFT